MRLVALEANYSDSYADYSNDMTSMGELHNWHFEITSHRGQLRHSIDGEDVVSPVSDLRKAKEKRDRSKKILTGP